MTSSRKGDTITLQITAPPCAVVGSWHMKLITVCTREDGVQRESVCPVYGIYILFNPWCEEDSVYLADQKERQEYVLNDVGTIWKGSHSNKQAIPWVYGQFEEGVLEACLLALDQSRLSVPLRSSPVHVCRKISQLLAKPDCGIIVGNWSSSFAQWTPPAAWTGSAPILREYASFGRPVRFGQCWVLAGVFTTVMRCLGIPCRVVTNYVSAHNLDNPSSVNIHFDQCSEKIKREYDTDAVWNFHCWNDCWMTRYDLSESGGWQAVDCTPQDKTDEYLHVGPAPVKALKEGNTGCSFNSESFYTEINAEKSYWVLNERREAKHIKTEFDKTGVTILTKMPGFQTDEPMDITQLYKDFKRPFSSRRLIMNALLRSNSLKTYSKNTEPKGDIEIGIDLKESSPMIGQNMTVGIVVTNQSPKERTVKLHVRIYAALYTGAMGRSVRIETSVLRISKNSTKQEKIQVTCREYLEKLLDQGCFTITVFGECQETNQKLALTDAWCLSFPSISIKVDGNSELNNISSVNLSFVNPLPVFLTNGRFVVEGAGLTKPKIVSCKGAPPNCWVSACMEMGPWESGSKTLVARFIADQIMDIHGSKHLKVK